MNHINPTHTPQVQNYHNQEHHIDEKREDAGDNKNIENHINTIDQGIEKEQYNMNEELDDESDILGQSMEVSFLDNSPSKKNLVTQPKQSAQVPSNDFIQWDEEYIRQEYQKYIAMYHQKIAYEEFKAYKQQVHAFHQMRFQFLLKGWYVKHFAEFRSYRNIFKRLDPDCHEDEIYQQHPYQAWKKKNPISYERRNKHQHHKHYEDNYDEYRSDNHKYQHNNYYQDIPERRFKKQKITYVEKVTEKGQSFEENPDFEEQQEKKQIKQYVYQKRKVPKKQVQSSSEEQEQKEEESSSQSQREGQEDRQGGSQQYNISQKKQENNKVKVQAQIAKKEEKDEQKDQQKEEKDEQKQDKQENQELISQKVGSKGEEKQNKQTKNMAQKQQLLSQKSSKLESLSQLTSNVQQENQLQVLRLDNERKKKKKKKNHDHKQTYTLVLSISYEKIRIVELQKIKFTESQKTLKRQQIKKSPNIKKSLKFEGIQGEKDWEIAVTQEDLQIQSLIMKCLVCKKTQRCIFGYKQEGVSKLCQNPNCNQMLKFEIVSKERMSI